MKLSSFPEKRYLHLHLRCWDPIITGSKKALVHRNFAENFPVYEFVLASNAVCILCISLACFLCSLTFKAPMELCAWFNCLLHEACNNQINFQGSSTMRGMILCSKSIANHPFSDCNRAWMFQCEGENQGVFIIAFLFLPLKNLVAYPMTASGYVGGKLMD